MHEMQGNPQVHSETSHLSRKRAATTATITREPYNVWPARMKKEFDDAQSEEELDALTEEINKQLAREGKAQPALSSCAFSIT